MGDQVTNPAFRAEPAHGGAGLSGRRGDLVYFMRGEKCFVRQYKGQRDARTSDQLAKRGYMGQAQSNWKRLAAADREAWQKFALENVFPSAGMSGRAMALAGFNAYVRAQIYRLGQGLELSLRAPVHPVPGPVSEIEELSPPHCAAYAFRIRHGMRKIEGHSVLFEISPAMPTLKRRPRTQDLRWAGVCDPESFLPLSRDGALYLLPKARFHVEPGRIFGVRVRIISPDGLPGPKLMVAFLRKVPDPDSWNSPTGGEK